MSTALSLLKRARGTRGYLYEQPWYVIIGPPGAGKTTALAEQRPEVSAGRRDGAGVGRRRRRHAALRLVVHRECRADRYRRPLHDPGFERRRRSRRLGGLPRSAAPDPAAPAAERRDRGDRAQRHRQSRRTTSAWRMRARFAGASRSSRSGSASVCRSIALFTKADLIAGFTEFFDDLDRERREPGLGRDIPVRQGERGTRRAVSRGAAAPGRPPERSPVRSPAGRAKPGAPQP